MGMSFAQQFVSFCSMKGVETDKLAKIESNPDRSKHLETARTTVLGIELDFVNLRSEEYTEDSRIPSHIVCGFDTHLSISIKYLVTRLLALHYRTRYGATLPLILSSTMYILAVSRISQRKLVGSFLC